MFKSSQHQRTLAPGPRGLDGLRALLALGHEERVFDRFSMLQREFGDVVGIPAGPSSVSLIYGPESARSVFKEKRATYGRGGPLQREAYPLLGQSLILNDDPATRQADRGEFTRALNAASLACFAPSGAADKLVSAMLDEWERRSIELGNEALDVAPDLHSLSFSIAGQAILGVDITDHERALTEDTHAFWKYTMARAALPVNLPRWVPTPAALGAKKFVREAHQAVDSILDRVLRGECADSPMAGLVAASPDPQADRSTLHQRLLTLLLASHETVYSMLCFTLHLLALNPECQEELNDARWCFDSTPRRVGEEPAYVTRVLRESLRLFPPAPANVRVALEEDEIEGYRIPQHSMVFYPIWVTHRDPRYWNDPETFQPDRFTLDGSKRIEDFAYFPFARGGARSCIGERFAMLEGELVISRIVERFLLAPGSGHAIRKKLVLNMVPSAGIHLRLEHR